MLAGKWLQTEKDEDSVGLTGADLCWYKWKRWIKGIHISDNALGCTMLLLSAVIASVASISIEIAEDEGVSSNEVTFWSCLFTVIGCILIDAFFWYFGYPSGSHVCS